MERFIKGGCYVVVKASEWDAFAAMCDEAGLGWGPRRTKASEYTPRPISEGKPLRVFALDGILLYASVSSPKTRDIPVMGFQNLKPITETADRAVLKATGRMITARLIAGRREVKITEATCSPDDTYRFGPGAMLALFRALGTEEDRVLALNLIAEERLNQLEATIPNVRDLVSDLTGVPAKHCPAKNNPAPGADDVSDLIAKALSATLGKDVLVIRQGPVYPGKSAFLQMVEDAIQTAAAEATKQ